MSSKTREFSAGADDYLTKPFALAEVQTRVAALHPPCQRCNRRRHRTRRRMRFNRRTREVHVGANRGAADAAKYAHSGAAVERSRAGGHARGDRKPMLWPDAMPQGDALRSQIHLLRRALVRAGFHGLETVHSVGLPIAMRTSRARLNVERRVTFALVAIVALFVSVQGALAFLSLQEQEDELVDELVVCGSPPVCGTHRARRT